jgi:hypothetical protein
MMQSSKLREMNRILYRHRWHRLDEWVRSLDDLADLSDDEIADLERLSIQESDADFSR